MWFQYFFVIAAAVLLPAAGFSLRYKPYGNSTGFEKSNGQILKGVAICLVVICHYMGYFGGGVVLFTPFGGIGVALFLFLSAYGLNEAWKIKGSKCWWRKRVLAVAVPYAIVQICLYWIQRDFSVSNFFGDVLLINPRYTYGWYLNYLFLWYVLFYAVMRVGLLRRRKMLIFGALTAVMFFVFDEIRAEQSLSFFAGIVFSEFKNREKIARARNWRSGVALVAIGVMFLALKQLSLVREAPIVIFNFVQLMIKLPCGLGVALVVLDLIKHIDFRFFGYVGSIAYEIYLVHGYILYRMPKSILGACGFIVISVAGSLLLKLLLKYVKKVGGWMLRIA